jgi:thioesterase domain-containing protein/acyl carrier protein
MAVQEHSMLLHERLAWLWADFTGELPTPQSHFLDHGGSSLDSIELSIEIKSRLGIEVSPFVVVENPTFQGLVTAVAEASVGPRRSMRLSWSQDDPTVVYFPSGYGFDASARELVGSWGGRALVLQYPGLEVGEHPLSRLPEIVEFVMTEIREAGVRSAIFLGYSAGAYIANATAAVGDAYGVTVESQVLLDPGSPCPVNDSSSAREAVARAVIWTLQRAHRHGLTIADVPDRADILAQLESSSAGDIVRAQLDSSGERLARAGFYAARAAVFEGVMSALGGFVATPPTSGRIVVIGGVPRVLDDWRRRMSAASLVHVVVEHGDMLTNERSRAEVRDALLTSGGAAALREES